MIIISDLEFRYNQNPPLFSHFNWKIEKGESWAVLGASGSGKTTLLHLLNALKKPTAGSITVGEHPLLRPRPETGLILQNHGLLPWATVWKNIELGFRFRRFYGPDGKHSPPEFRSDREEEKELINQWLEKMGLKDLKNRYPHALSGGQQQRTAIARTLVLKPDLLLMDEPFSSLDSPTRKSLQKLVMDLEKEREYSRILVTHSIEEALIMGNRILILRDSGKEPLILENSGSDRDLLYRQIHNILGEQFE